MKHAALPVLSFALAFGAASFPAHAQERGEEFFKRALEYTVQIRTTVVLPFDGDRKGTGTGSGFVVDAERGWVLTNAHVVSRSPARVQVSFQGRDYALGEKIYVDPFLDLALVQLGKDHRPPRLVAGDMDCGESPSVGHAVGAFGHPWGLKYTGTRGIVSGVTNQYDTEMLQTDAPINSGNSGGPLISLVSGKIVGINTAGLNPGQAQNTNFAVAAKYACKIVELLRQGKDPSPPAAGLVYFRDIDDRKQLRVAKTYLPTNQLAVKPGDTLREVRGERGTIANETQLIHALRGRLDNFSLTVSRDGKDETVSGSWNAAPRVMARKGVHFSGIVFNTREYADLQESGLGRVFVAHIERASLGESLEVEYRQTVETIDGKPVQTLEDAFAALKTAFDEKRRAKIIFKRLIGRGAGVFGYVERDMPVRNLFWVENKKEDPAE
jgi:serine protease Do